MKNLTLYTSEQLESMEIENFESITEQCTFQYQLTDPEMGWLLWIGDRYSISKYIWENTDEKNIFTCEVLEVEDALTEEGLDRAPCLSEETQLARLIWFIGPNRE